MITKDFTQMVPFIGIVEDIKDPEQLGRARVRVINHHDDSVKTEELDWATPIIPNSPAHQGVGTSPTGLVVGSMVVGFFLDGKTRAMPMIMGAFNKIPGGDKKKHDVPKRARGINEVKNKEVGPEPKPAYAAKYPNNQVIQTTSGHIVELDDTPGKERVHVRHKSGSYVEINNKGRVVIKAADDQFFITAGDSKHYTDKKATYESKGKMTITTKDKVDIIATGECKVTSKKKITLSAPKVDLMG
jgi:hypothetical protein